jgi:cyclase
MLHFDYIHKSEGPLPPALLAAIDAKTVSEVIVTDWRAEGTETPFSLNLLEHFPTDRPQLIAFGGLCNPGIAARALAHPHCVAVAIGNYLNYREHAVQSYKTAMKNHGVRPPQFHPFKTEQPIYAPDL